MSPFPHADMRKMRPLAWLGGCLHCFFLLGQKGHSHRNQAKRLLQSYDGQTISGNVYAIQSNVFL